MNEIPSTQEAIESRLRQTAASFSYPPTPDIAAVERRRLTAGELPAERPRPTVGRRARLIGGALAAILLLLAVALSVPQVRAALFEFFNIGAIGILVDEEATTPRPGHSLLDLAGEMTLSEAEEMVGFDIRLPTYPADLGRPDRVFVQRLVEGGRDQVVILVWLDPDRTDRARLSLYQIAVPYYGLKQALPENVRRTRVGGQPAIWVEGPHSLQLQSGAYQESFLVPGSALVWTGDQLTYRLESGLSMEEAVRIGQSLERRP